MTFKSRLLRDAEEIRILYWRDGLSMKKIASLYGCCENTVMNLRKELGVDRRATITNSLLVSKKKIQELYNNGFSYEKIAKECGCSKRLITLLKNKLGIKSRSREAKERVNCDGYLYLSEKGRKMTKHRRIASEALGRKLQVSEIVHHVNGDKQNNKNHNLLVCDRAYHKWLHDKMSRLYMKEHFAT